MEGIHSDFSALYRENLILVELFAVRDAEVAARYSVMKAPKLSIPPRKEF